ncbi:putative SF-assemblin [Neospora caninum Liverpool]|uniref:Putative SF-assemblin n=1 Tax=Neospora caninum (strain Liverpool) TaxID=572307 RepID=F0VER7_NEOCL|nr:putative SF-assemblin [Neospora caninum Liverpool]CBZ52211.1 putative SF-assemblin [Neospora caninum Liverpool]|eukprot:XP_003882243.1 putative SF-assemblin [Neospora caninum Liverpool]
MGGPCTMAGAAGSCSGEAGKSERLRMQLSSVGERFIGFKTSIADDTRRRRMMEEQRFQEVKESIARLEKALNSEIKRRVEANRTLQRVAEQMANEMLERLQTRIAKQIEKLTISMDLLITRCEGLERNLAQMKGELPSKLAQETVALVSELMTLKEQFELEKKGSIDREQMLVKRLNELQYGLDARLEAEIALRQEQLNHLKKDVEQLVRGDESHEQFRTFIVEELQAMKSGLALATQAREQSDDEIIHAINQYTTALQKGLRNITSR